MKSRRVFLSISAIVFAASAAMTIVWAASMAAMGEMEMPGGWTMSHMWMLMPGQSWLGAFVSFVGMWVVMMVAMMMPSLTPTLWRNRQTIAETPNGRAYLLTAIVAATYFLVWALIGMIVFPLGVVLATIVMRQPALARGVPLILGLVVLIAGVVQRTGWKARQLKLCREMAGLTPAADMTVAWRFGLCLGVHCVKACAGLTAVSLALGLMDLRVMGVVATAITAERLAPAGTRLAPAIGAGIVGAGLVLWARAIGS